MYLRRGEREVEEYHPASASFTHSLHSSSTFKHFSSSTPTSANMHFSTLFAAAALAAPIFAAPAAIPQPEADISAIVRQEPPLLTPS
jgi:hypothetical protein